MQNYIIITIDYETWHPVSKEDIRVMRNLGLKIDWKKDIIEPIYKLMDSADSAGAKLTLMVEMGEYIWLKKNGKYDITRQIEVQLQDAILRNHDVQLHLHPHWLPETGAHVNEMSEWEGNIDYAAADSYPYDLAAALQQCKNELEAIIHKVRSDYEVCCYRAGGYRVQPFERLYDALVSNGIHYDTSVYYKGKAKDRGYDFSECTHQIQPYYVGRTNPAVEDSGDVMEIPIYANKHGHRWVLDGMQGNELAIWYYTCDDIEKHNDNYYVMVGHSKGEHDYKKIEEQLKILALGSTNQWLTLSDAVKRLSNKSVLSVSDIIVDSVEAIYGKEKREKLFDIMCNVKVADNEVMQQMWVDFVLVDMKKSGYKVEAMRFLRDDSRLLKFMKDGVKSVFDPVKDKSVIYKNNDELQHVIRECFHKRGMYIIEKDTKMLKVHAYGIKRKVLSYIVNFGKDMHQLLRIRKV